MILAKQTPKPPELDKLHVREAVAAAMSASAIASQSRELRVTTRKNRHEYNVCV